MRTFTLFAAVGLALVLATAARADLSFRAGYEDYGGALKIKIVALNNGAVYPSLGAAGTVVSGEAAVDAIAGQVPPAGGMPGEDSWGVAKVTTITTPAGDILWQDGDFDLQLTALFYGEVDFYVEQIDAANQRIGGTGLSFALYEDSTVGGTPYDPSPGSAARTALTAYTTVTDGTLVLSGVSVAGHIHMAGVAGGLATEFESRYNTSSLTGDGDAFLQVTGGRDAALFDTDTFDPLDGAYPKADLQLAWDTYPALVGPDPGDSGGSDWLVEADDPIRGTYVPEPATLGLVAAGALALVRRRRR
jgi:hypothetical protein